MTQDHEYKRALEIARLLVTADLDPVLELREVLETSLSTAPPGTWLNLIEVLVITVSGLYEDVDDWREHLMESIARLQESGEDEGLL